MAQRTSAALEGGAAIWCVARPDGLILPLTRLPQTSWRFGNRTSRSYGVNLSGSGTAGPSTYGWSSDADGQERIKKAKQYLRKLDPATRQAAPSV